MTTEGCFDVCDLGEGGFPGVAVFGNKDEQAFFQCRWLRLTADLMREQVLEEVLPIFVVVAVPIRSECGRQPHDCGLPTVHKRVDHFACGVVLG